jgi:DNA (cytosine-5)-methyltransferase 1
MAVLGRREPFLLVYYGSDQAGGWQRLDRTLRTVTTLDRFALVKPTSNGHMMRMLQVPELKTAMGMPKCFRIDGETRRGRIRLVGNAVCPPVMRAAVRSLIGATDQ